MTPEKYREQIEREQDEALAKCKRDREGLELLRKIGWADGEHLADFLARLLRSSK